MLFVVSIYNLGEGRFDISGSALNMAKGKALKFVMQNELCNL